MINVSFDNPKMLFTLILIPLYIYFYIKSNKNKINKIKEFSAINFIEFYKFPKYKKHAAFITSIFALVFMVISISDPKVQGSVITEEKTLILVLDTSKSMAADDVAPTRFEAAVETAKIFLDNVPNGYKVGLVNFSGISEVLSIPTTDITKIKDKLDNLTLENGTATGDALLLALSQFGENSKGGVIVLISDGRQTAGISSIEAASGALLGAGVKAYTIALGTPTGRIVIEEQSNNTEKTIFSVPPDPVGMAKIASITGGQTYTAFTINDLSGIYKSVAGKLNVEPGLISVSWLSSLLALLFLVITALFLKIFRIN
jgi:Ca-activated chloride channel family protein